MNTASMLVFLTGDTNIKVSVMPKASMRDDRDGCYEVHVNTMAGFWSLLRSWLRLNLGISQEKLPLYLGNFIVHA
jgi:hypothetical protein